MKKNPPISVFVKVVVENGEKWLGVRHQDNPAINRLTRSLPDVRWSQKHNVHVLPFTTPLSKLFAVYEGVAWVNTKHLEKGRPQNSGAKAFKQNNACGEATETTGKRRCPAEFLEKLELRGYAKNTAKSYISCFEYFINYYKNTALNSINETHIRRYLKFLQRKGQSFSAVNIHLNAIKFYFEVVRGVPHRFYAIERPRKSEKLPKVLAKSEIKALIASIKNSKHRCIVSLLYSAGLRRQEVLNLRPADIDSERMLIKILDGKGRKDRYTLLSPKLLTELRKYYRHYRPKKLLFEGPGGKAYSGSSVGAIVKRAGNRAGIRQRVTPHMLRHSFATHLLEDGIDLRYIQHLLGHSQSKTTEIYTRVATNKLKSIKNPLDSLY